MNEKNNLIKWATSQLGKKLDWGISDCASLTSEGFKIVYGYDPFPYLEKWKNKDEALKLYAKVGKPSEILKLDPNFTEIKKNYCQTGDIVILDTSPMQTTSIVIDNGILIFDEEKGVILQKFKNIKYNCYCFRGILCQD